MQNVTASDMQVALERNQVGVGDVSASEQIGYVAISPGRQGQFTSATGGTVQYETQATTNLVNGWDNGCNLVSFTQTYASAPITVASPMTRNGADGAWFRRCSTTTTGISLTADEDNYYDSERSHPMESAGMLVFRPSFYATLNDPRGGAFKLESGWITLPQTSTQSGFYQVNFKQTYSTPPVVLALTSNQGTTPAAVRIRNVTATGFEMVQVEPDNNDGPHESMLVAYMAIEPGTHEFPDGTRVEVGTVSTSAIQGTGIVPGTKSWANQSFSPFVIPPPAPIASAFEDYGYDANGNRVSFNDASLSAYSYVAATNRLLQITKNGVSSDFAYDAAGNILSDGTHSYTYNNAGELQSVAGVDYIYNAFHQRIFKQNGSTKVFYVYNEADQLIGEYDASGNAIQETVWMGEVPVATVRNGQVFYIFSDQLNTPRVITDTQNKIVWRWDSDPFGRAIADEDPDGDGTYFTFNLRFPGQYYDVETGLHYNWNRYYDPRTGRYITSDPLGLDGGLNTYGYVGGNPLMNLDPYGLDLSSVVGKRKKPGTLVKKLLCAANELICARRDAEIRDRKNIRDDNLKNIQENCDANIKECLDKQTKKERDTCVERHSKICAKQVDDEIDDYSKDRNKILERYKYNPAIQEVCDSLP